MKTYSWLVLAMALTSPCLQAQLSIPLSTTAPTAVDVGPHHRVWQKVSADEHGQTIANSYTELETGMNFLDPATGQYEESEASFEISPKGYAVARKGQHQASLAPNINSAGAVTLLTPDGYQFISNPMGLSYFDTATGTNVLLAEVKDCIGQFIPPNVILYEDAFTDIKGAIRYTYTKAGFEQDVLIYDSTGLGSPEDYGLNASTTLLEMYSEFHESPTPQKTTQLTLEGFPDETLNFGLMAIGQGTAFDLDMAEQSIHVAKSWLSISGRTFLVESVPFTAARPSLDKLRASVSNDKAMKVAQRTVPDRRRLVALASMRPKTTTKEVAHIQTGRMREEKGYLIDYTTLNTGQTNYLFRGDMTYFISGVVYLSGKTVFEGGAVIKYDSSTTPGLWVQGSVDCQATGYRPLVMTGKDDNTAGEIISGSTGLPTAAGYGNYGIAIDNTASTDTSWSNLRFAYLRSAFYVNRQATHTLSHAQIVNCGKAILVYASSDVRVRNVLVDQAVTAFDQGSGTARGENLTIHRTTNLKLEPNGPVPLYVINSLIVGVTNVPATTNSFLSTSSYVFTNDVPAIFQTVGAASHYLSDNTYRNSGTTNSSLAAELKKLTTYPPIVLTNDFTVSTTLTPQAQRDTDIPDLGWHYFPIDYCLSGISLTNSTLTLTNGVAVAFYGTNGLTLKSGAKFVSEGTALSPNRLFQYCNVQEQPIFWGASTNSLKMFPIASYPAVLPELRLQFTHIPFLAVVAYRHYIFDTTSGLSQFSMKDCQVQGAWLGFLTYGSSPMTAGLTNNLIERCVFQFVDGTGSVTPYSVNLRDNLVFRGQLNLTHNTANAPWSIYDNLFDWMSYTYTGTISNGYNAYYLTGQIPGSTGGDITLTNAPDYLAGPLGSYYYPTNGGNLSRLIDAGSRTAELAGLYHYTVRFDQLRETNSVVDIGYHYLSAAMPANGLVGWWRLDETAGTTAADSSANGHNGTLLNGPTWTTGTVGGALRFDGTNDSVSVPDAADLRLGTTMTLAFWVQKDANPTNYTRLIGKGSSSLRNYMVWSYTAGTLLFQFQRTDGAYLNLFSTTALQVGSWYHVACTYNGSSAAIYINGVLDASLAFSGTPVTSTDPLTFAYGGWNEYHKGLLDDLRIYNLALSGSEIASLVNPVLWDTDGDGIPDYLEDRNGNGVYDTGDLANFNSSDTDADGMSDGQEIQLGTNPNLDESAQTGSRLNYLYDPAGRLNQVSGARTETVSVDGEGNVKQNSN